MLIGFQTVFIIYYLFINKNESSLVVQNFRTYICYGRPENPRISIIVLWEVHGKTATINIKTPIISGTVRNISRKFGVST